MIKLFSELTNFNNVKNCLCIFHKFDKLFGLEGSLEFMEQLIPLKIYLYDNNGKIVFLTFNNNDYTYVDKLIKTLFKIFPNSRQGYNKICKNILYLKYTKKYDSENIFNYIKLNTKNMPQFDYIIQNPPYVGPNKNTQLHLEFFNKGLDILSDNGKMVVIEPSTWLINLRNTVPNNKKWYMPLKNRIKNHVSKIIIENFNKSFNISSYVPLSITYIDKSSKYDEIEFINCGEYKKVTNVNDCNLIGNYEIIQSILTKCKSYGDMMKDHIYDPGKTKIDENTKFLFYANIVGQGGCGGHGYGIFKNMDSDFQHTKNGEFQNSVIDVLCRKTNTDTYKLYGTKEELENWKYFAFNNKLPLFLGISLITDQNNTVKQYVPWIVNNQYTDDEIYKILNINKDEQLLINLVIKKFERNSEWFKRYISGK